MKTTWLYDALEFPVSTALIGGSVRCDIAKLVDAINHNAREGWELASTFSLVSTNSIGGEGKVVAIMRRPLAQPPPLHQKTDAQLETPEELT